MRCWCRQSGPRRGHSAPRSWGRRSATKPREGAAVLQGAHRVSLCCAPDWSPGVPSAGRELHAGGSQATGLDAPPPAQARPAPAGRPRPMTHWSELAGRGPSGTASGSEPRAWPYFSQAGPVCMGHQRRLHRRRHPQDGMARSRIPFTPWPATSSPDMRFLPAWFSPRSGSTSGCRR